VLRAGTIAAVGGLGGAATAGCESRFTDTRITLGTGGSQGLYYAFGGTLADAWQHSLGLAQRPTVRATAGSVDNLMLLDGDTVDVIFSAADVADAQLDRPSRPGREIRALARIYDDALQVVAPANSPITQVTDLRGKRVSIGATDSGVIVMADCLLAVAGLNSTTDLSASMLGIDDSIAALRAGRIDAFFWSGGLPTVGVSSLAAAAPIRLLDLAPQMPALRKRFPIYDVGTVPAATYGIPKAVTTMFVRNFLLVPASMPDQLANALVAGLFAASDELVQTNPAGRAIDARSAIGTQPVPLHPGALRYYRENKAYD
jgi:TRAP transporter TAXI family solute receptor